MRLHSTGLLNQSIFHFWILATAVFATQFFTDSAFGQAFLNASTHLQDQSFWDNRDFAWYEANIPILECPDPDVTTTYYYRWELLTKHLTYGSANSGYSFTEFIDRPFWSGAFGAISCPAGHQLYEARWLRSPRIAEDYTRYWFRTPGAQPRNYSTWLADSAWAIHQVHPNHKHWIDLLPDLVKNYEEWEQKHFVPEVGLFWQTGHDDGMEYNIASRQTQDILRGAPSYRPSFNAYMWADAKAIARLARLANQAELAQRFDSKAEALHQKMIQHLWDERRQFFLIAFKNAEERDGHKIAPLARIYDSGRYAGDTHGRELIGYVPWAFSMFPPHSRYDVAWKKLIDKDGFQADFGPTTVERNDPQFVLKKTCCWWSGQSWPYATTQTLKGLANYLQQGGQALSKQDYYQLLQIYARSHRKDGRPYLAEALHPDTGSFEGHDGYNHSEHYFHSGYVDLIITGLFGLVPRSDRTIELRPLLPNNWEYAALDSIPYHGHRLAIVWDRDGNRYAFGPGLHVLLDGKRIGTSSDLAPMTLDSILPETEPSNTPLQDAKGTLTNFAVNNEGTYYPRLNSSFTAPGTAMSKLQDGNYWYTQHPPNRWSTEGSPEHRDWVEIDFGTPRAIHLIKLYVLDDTQIPGTSIRAPQQIDLEAFIDDTWVPIAADSARAQIPKGHQPWTLEVPPITTAKLRATLHHAQGFRSGLTEIEAWGWAHLPLPGLPHPSGNLAYRKPGENHPKATASYTDRFGGRPDAAIDGITNFLPTPMNRWTSYESPNNSDHLLIDFGKEIEFRKVELAIYDDRGGVQPPTQYFFEIEKGSEWIKIDSVTPMPATPQGNRWNTASFPPVRSRRLRIVFEHQGKARSGVTEVMVWNQ